MTDQPRPSESGDDPGAAAPGHDRKTPAKRVTLGTGDTIVLANYIQRFRARVADSLLIGIGFVIAGVGFLWIYWPYLLQLTFFGQQPERPSAARVFWANSVFIPLLWYEIVAVAWSGRTLGMRSLGIRVVSIQSGQKPSVFESFSRGALPVYLHPLFLVDGLGLLLGVGACWWLLVHASVFWGEDRRGWHDLVAGTVVVTSDPPVPADPSGGDTA